jgi:hypothetical protein
VKCKKEDTVWGFTIESLESETNKTKITQFLVGSEREMKVNITLIL